LGETLPEIAFEKGGIIKPGIPVVIGEVQGETLPVFEKLALESKAPVIVADQQTESPFETDLIGNYQQKNLQTALKTFELLQKEGFEITHSHIQKGLVHVAENTGLKGRYQVLRDHPKVICDTAHNREGLELVLDQVLNEGAGNLHFVLGFVNDKDLDTVLPLFPKEAIYYFCRPDIPRGLEAKVLQEKAKKYGLAGQCYEGVSEAYEAALGNAGPEDLIYAGGSTFVVAEMPL
jgi:dihydrofolate synthase/folylpolyglutamate synthase